MRNTSIVTIPSHPKYLCVVRCVTSVMGGLYGLASSEIEDIKLAVDEACSNVIKHAYGGDTSKKIVVEFRMTKKAFTVIIEDSGRKAHPECIKGRSLDEVRPGGLGVHLIKRAFDIFAFDEQREKGNRLTLIRHAQGTRGKR
jgi:anti-sigma regulatory factor (Ser/Thr protein kinase)